MSDGWDALLTSIDIMYAEYKVQAVIESCTNEGQMIMAHNMMYAYRKLYPSPIERLREVYFHQAYKLQEGQARAKNKSS